MHIVGQVVSASHVKDCTLWLSHFFFRPATQETERPSQASAQSRGGVKGETSQSSRTGGGSRTGHGPRLDVGVAKRTILSSLGGRGAKDGGVRKDRYEGWGLGRQVWWGGARNARRLSEI